MRKQKGYPPARGAQRHGTLPVTLEVSMTNDQLTITPENKHLVDYFTNLSKLITLQKKASSPKVEAVLRTKVQSTITDNIELFISSISLFGLHPVIKDDSDNEIWLAPPEQVDDLRQDGLIAYTFEELKESVPHDFATYAKVMFRGEEVDYVDFDSLIPAVVYGMPKKRKLEASLVKQIMRLNSSIKVCRACVLAESRKNTVPGEGYLAPHIVFVAEGPGQNEDDTGRPFVGKAGVLLDDLLAGSGINRKDVFITNIVKCRPPKNRTPATSEVRACRSFLENQLAALKPVLIVPLGSPALKWFMPAASISQVRGQFVKANGYDLLPTYHPAAVLRNSSYLPAVREDFGKILPTCLQLLTERKG